VSTTLEPGQRLRIVKFIAYGWSEVRSVPALRDQVAAALGRPPDRLGRKVAEQTSVSRRVLGPCRRGGRRKSQRAAGGAVALFHLLQVGARTERRAIAAKGLTGPGYDGHAFWDTETFVLAVLTYTVPHAVAHALRWRCDTLGLAVERATQFGLAGAAFPWRTIAGRECSAYWPAGTAGFHINAEIAMAVARYVGATEDRVRARGGA